MNFRNFCERLGKLPSLGTWSRDHTGRIKPWQFMVMGIPFGIGVALSAAGIIWVIQGLGLLPVLGWIFVICVGLLFLGTLGTFVLTLAQDICRLMRKE